MSDAGKDDHCQIGPLKITPFKLPDSCLGGYYPEMNPLSALSRYDIKSKTPAFKGVPLRIVPVPA